MKHMKRFTFLVIREVQIKTTKVEQYIPIRMSLKNLTLQSPNKDVVQLEHSYCGWEYKMVQPLCKNSLVISDKVNLILNS